jgi:hypothetical protein
MQFKPEKVKEFLDIIQEKKEKIRAFEGCTYFELYTDKKTPGLFFTYTKWRSEADLEVYRHSELFQATWSRTKLLFSEKPLAWSLHSIIAIS